AYAAALGRFVVAGNRGAQGFVALLDRDGALVRMQEGLPPLASESRVLIGRSGGQDIAVYPVVPSGIAVLRLDQAGVELQKVVAHPQRWDYMGTTGLFIGGTRVLFATLTTQGVRAFTVEL
ncbi:MAG TPA: hypothetical protein VH105_19575, partial [Burkholderiales bacterium]|nr:hypothetical protein [Burkholderiales bacterium]